MIKALKNQPSQRLIVLDTRQDFCDGFKIAKGTCEGSLDLQRFLINNDIPAKLPSNHPSKDYRFVRLASQENDIVKTLKNINETYEPMRKEIVDESGETDMPILRQFDVTRDFKGTFYAQDNWKE